MNLIFGKKKKNRKDHIDPAQYKKILVDFKTFCDMPTYFPGGHTAHPMCH